MTHEIRCTAPHPAHPGRACNAKLGEAQRGSVVVNSGKETAPGCVKLRCGRCGMEYVVCPRAA